MYMYPSETMAYESVKDAARELADSVDRTTLVHVLMHVADKLTDGKLVPESVCANLDKVIEEALQEASQGG